MVMMIVELKFDNIFEFDIDIRIQSNMRVAFAFAPRQ